MLLLEWFSSSSERKSLVSFSIFYIMFAKAKDGFSHVLWLLLQKKQVFWFIFGPPKLWPPVFKMSRWHGALSDRWVVLQRPVRTGGSRPLAAQVMVWFGSNLFLFWSSFFLKFCQIQEVSSFLNCSLDLLIFFKQWVLTTGYVTISMTMWFTSMAEGDEKQAEDRGLRQLLTKTLYLQNLGSKTCCCLFCLFFEDTTRRLDEIFTCTFAGPRHSLVAWIDPPTCSPLTPSNFRWKNDWMCRDAKDDLHHFALFLRQRVHRKLHSAGTNYTNWDQKLGTSCLR